MLEQDVLNWICPWICQTKSRFDSDPTVEFESKGLWCIVDVLMTSTWYKTIHKVFMIYSNTFSEPSTSDCFLPRLEAAGLFFTLASLAAGFLAVPADGLIESEMPSSCAPQSSSSSSSPDLSEASRGSWSASSFCSFFVFLFFPALAFGALAFSPEDSSEVDTRGGSPWRVSPAMLFLKHVKGLMNKLI